MRTRTILRKMARGLVLLSVILLGLVSIIATNGNGPAWKPVGAESFSEGAASYLSLFVDNGVPYVAYRDETRDNKLTVKQFNGSDWVTLGSPGFSFGEITWNTDIYVSQNTPYVAYQDNSTSPPGKAVVMKFTDGVWENVDRPDIEPGFSPDAAAELSLYVGSAMMPYVAFQDWGHQKKATVMKWNNVNWVYVGGEPAVSEGQAHSISLDVFLGSPYIAYEDRRVPDNAGKATVRQFDNSAWIDVGNAEFSAAEVQYTSLDVNENQVSFVAYQDWGHSKKATVMKYSAGSRWQPVGNPGFSSGIAGRTLVSVEGDTPYVAFPDENRDWKVTVKKFEDDSWKDVGSPDAPVSTGEVTYRHGLMVSGGTPYLAFVDVSNGRRVTVLKYE